MAKRKPKVGETLFLTTFKQYIRTTTGKTCIVSKVGLKYFYITRVGCSFEIQFRLDSWCEKSEDTSCYSLYESEQEWIDTCLADKYHEAIYKAFDTYGNRHEMTLSQLKQIAEILDITIEEDKT